MKLTNYIRDAFITSVMHDVPAGKDYEQIISDAVREAFVAKMPDNLQKAWKDTKQRAYIQTTGFRDFGVSIAVPRNCNTWGSLDKSELTEAQRKPLQALCDEWNAEKQLREGLRQKLKGAAYGCTTRKALVELLPEFEKYLPAEEEKTCRTLPVIANMMAEFTQAGWPKDGKKGGKK